MLMKEAGLVDVKVSVSIYVFMLVAHRVHISRYDRHRMCVVGVHGISFITWSLHAIADALRHSLARSHCVWDLQVHKIHDWLWESVYTARRPL